MDDLAKKIVPVIPEVGDGQGIVDHSSAAILAMMTSLSPSDVQGAVARKAIDDISSKYQDLMKSMNISDGEDVFVNKHYVTYLRSYVDSINEARRLGLDTAQLETTLPGLGDKVYRKAISRFKEQKQYFPSRIEDLVRDASELKIGIDLSNIQQELPSLYKEYYERYIPKLLSEVEELKNKDRTYIQNYASRLKTLQEALVTAKETYGLSFPGTKDKVLAVIHSIYRKYNYMWYPRGSHKGATSFWESPDL